MLWNKSYETGVPIMDSQHKELFRQLDILADKGKADRVPQTLEFLAKYVDKHFKDEERMHMSSAYPQQREHKKMHSDFVETYKQLSEEYTKNPAKKEIMALKITRIATDWLQRHILGADMAFANYYLEKTGGRKAEEIQPQALFTPSKKPAAQAARATGKESGYRPMSQRNDEEILRRIPARDLADELVRRTRNGGFKNSGA